MPNYRYRALNGSGELVSGAIAASAPGDVAQRIERLGLVLVDNVALEEGGAGARGVNLTTTLRILVDMMSSAGPSAGWGSGRGR